jgi:hypothetical protein
MKKCKIGWNESGNKSGKTICKYPLLDRYGIHANQKIQSHWTEGVLQYKWSAKNRERLSHVLLHKSKQHEEIVTRNPKF